MAEVSINLEVMAEAVRAAERAEQVIPEAVEVLERHLRALEMDTEVLRPWRHDGERTYRLRERTKELRERRAKAHEVSEMLPTFHAMVPAVRFDEIQLTGQAEQADYAALVDDLKESWLSGTLNPAHLLAFSDLLRLHAMNPVFMKIQADRFTRLEMGQFMGSLDQIAATLPPEVRGKLGLWSGFTSGPGKGLPSNKHLVGVNPGILNTDPMDPALNQQRQVGDCWLVATLNAVMETAEGDQFIRDHVRWDPKAQGYWVTLYLPGYHVSKEFLVTEVIDEGAQADGRQGIVSIYEAAAYQAYGWSFLEGRMPWEGPAVILGDSTQTWTGAVLPIADNAAETGGSADGGVTLATTAPEQIAGGLYIPTQVVDASGNQVQIEVPANHVMEVVDIRPDGMIGIRNPWGCWLDLNHQYVRGVVYVTPEVFDQTFLAHTSTEWTMP